MNLAIFHYHLNRGGVTRVIENQLLALDAVLDPAKPWQVALVYGGRRQGWSDKLADRLRAVRLTLHEVPLLDYDEEWESDGEPKKGPDLICAKHPPGHSGKLNLVPFSDLHEQITTVLDRLHFTPHQTVLHTHNHSLGKNRLLPAVISRLAEDGYAALLQMHDFAEDFRPDNFRQIRREAAGGLWGNGAAALYPQSTGIHYAVLNGRDHDILTESGVEAGRLHLLPNPVPGMNHLPAASDARRRLKDRFDVDPSDRFVLYPVRCIRRKNIGEALLYSTLMPAGTTVGLTLAPWNPVEIPTYEAWKELAVKLDLPCRFEVGGSGGLSFAENLAAADVIITTSLAEGFGMVFFESWLAGRPLVGRDLPEITRDFTRAGLRLDWLEPCLQVPLEWVGLNTFQRAVIEGYRRTLAAYGREEPDRWLEDLDAKTADGTVDFGDLDESMQRTVIQTVCRDQRNRRRVLECNPWLEETMNINAEDAAGVIDENARTIHRHYSLEPSGRRLLEVFGYVAASPRGEETQPLRAQGRILDYFLDLKRFRLIRG